MDNPANFGPVWLEDALKLHFGFGPDDPKFGKFRLDYVAAKGYPGHGDFRRKIVTVGRKNSTEIFDTMEWFFRVFLLRTGSSGWKQGYVSVCFCKCSDATMNIERTRERCAGPAKLMRTCVQRFLGEFRPKSATKRQCGIEGAQGLPSNMSFFKKMTLCCAA